MAKQFFTETDQERIISAIRDAEKATSGEIRVHVEPECKIDPYERAREVFEKLGMGATNLKNGVLFYMAYKDKKFAVLGDQGIHEKVTDTFWNEEKEVLLSHFKESKFADGLCIAILKAGDKLQQHFPYAADDKDELSNDISFEGGQDA